MLTTLKLQCNRIKNRLSAWARHNDFQSSTSSKRLTIEIQTLLTTTINPRIAIFSSGTEEPRSNAFELLDQFTDIEIEYRYFDSNCSTFVTSETAPTVSALLNTPREQFDLCIITKSAKLLDNQWSMSYLHNVAKSLKSGGYLAVHINPSLHEYHLSAKKIQKFINQPAIGSSDAWALFRVNNYINPAPKSVLTWFRDHNLSFLMTDLLLNKNQLSSKDIPSNYNLDTFFLNSAENIPDYKSVSQSAQRRAKNNGIVDRDFEFNRLAKRYSYLLSSISFKASSVTHIITDLIGSRRNLHLCDLGGGIGFLGIELVLDPKSPVESATNIDLNAENMRLASEIYYTWQCGLAERIKFWVGSFTEYDYACQPDVVTMIGSLLYASKEERVSTIQNAWNALNPGGLIIVHENIKDERFADDYEVMFEADELDQLLENFAPVLRYTSHSFTRCSKEQAGNKSVFRVIQKT